MAGMVSDLEPDAARMREAASASYSTATDVADWLVRRLGLPFREAHHVTGQLVAAAAARNVGLEELTLADMQTVEPRITGEIFSVLSVDKSVASRTSYGGTAPANVREQAQKWLDRLEPGRNTDPTSSALPSH
jgi:argininosuccinate lyase